MNDIVPPPWQFAGGFTLSEAAHLVVGLDPSIPDLPLTERQRKSVLAAQARIENAMEAAYEFTRDAGDILEVAQINEHENGQNVYYVDDVWRYGDTPEKFLAPLELKAVVDRALSSFGWTDEKADNPFLVERNEWLEQGKPETLAGEDLNDFLARNGIASAFDFVAQKFLAQRCPPNTLQEDTPYGANPRSPNLVALNLAYSRFWANADPEDRTSHPTNQVVAAFLVEQRMSPTMAKRGASIIRPPWAAVGRPEAEE